jgi:glycosyltransferase involved in cell wall biosynthesis
MKVSAELLSVLIPTRDRPELLEACLRSVFESQDAIHVVVSDNSTRDHPEIEQLRARYRFTYVRQSGLLRATDHFNACLKLTPSKWIWMLHDDDELYPGAVARMAARLHEAGDVGLVVGGLHYIDHAGVKQLEWIPNSVGESRGEEGLLAAGLDPGALSPGMVFRADAALKWGGFVEIGGHPADYTFLVGLAHDYGVAFLPEVVGRYRHGAHQETDVSSPGAAKAWLDFTIAMAEHTIERTKCSAHAAEQILDYMTWFTFMTLMPRWLPSHTQFVFAACRDCLDASPARLRWQAQVRENYPMLFWQPAWVAAGLCRAGSLVGRVQRKLRQVGHALRNPNPC